MAASLLSLNDFARAILFGGRLEDKLVELPAGLPDIEVQDATHPASTRIETPKMPGRPAALARFGKADFPKLDRLAKDATARGQVLHFFANHELLAMELMALVLLRFPDAPPAFRAGLARTITEEQSHMRLYIDRMQELGVSFGDLPLSDYFWNAIKDVASPLEFVTQMSLTLEQANLDFSLFYKQAIEKAGDAKTAAILERVYREEIGHVKHGLQWFNHWRAEDARGSSGEDDWDAFLRLLPPPMTPRRAKGLSFSIESRREAGFSERFIHELEVYGGSKGRPPVFWFYNPLCDAEIARGRPGLSSSQTVASLGLDLEPLLMQLATEQDVVLVHELPRTSFLKQLRELGFSVPEFRLIGKSGELPRDAKIGGVEPWGWSPESFDRFRPWRERLVGMSGGNGTWAAKTLTQETFEATGFARFFSKSWSTDFLREWLVTHPEDTGVFGAPASVGRTYRDWDTARTAILSELKNCPTGCVAKAPFGTSGMQNKRVLKPQELEGPLGGWIQNTIKTQGGIVIEPWFDKIADLSMQLEIPPDMPVDTEEVRLLGVRRFYVGSRLEYRGTELDAKLTALDPETQRFLHSNLEPLERWKKLARALGKKLSQAGYRGPAGIDALVWRERENGELRLKPLVELNLRWTMGRVALAIEERVLPGTPARWVFAARRELTSGQSFEAFAQELEGRHPVSQRRSGAGFRISEGIVCTNDPTRAREILTVLAVGPRACSEPLLRCGD